MPWATERCHHESGLASARDHSASSAQLRLRLCAVDRADDAPAECAWLLQAAVRLACATDQSDVRSGRRHQHTRVPCRVGNARDHRLDARHQLPECMCCRSNTTFRTPSFRIVGLCPPSYHQWRADVARAVCGGPEQLILGQQRSSTQALFALVKGTCSETECGLQEEAWGHMHHSCRKHWLF